MKNVFAQTSFLIQLLPILWSLIIQSLFKSILKDKTVSAGAKPVYTRHFNASLQLLFDFEETINVKASEMELANIISA